MQNFHKCSYLGNIIKTFWTFWNSLLLPKLFGGIIRKDSNLGASPLDWKVGRPRV